MKLYHKLYAKLNGYFWLPCPVCGEYFGGHESTGNSLMYAFHEGGMPYKGQLVCQRHKNAHNLTKGDSITVDDNIYTIRWVRFDWDKYVVDVGIDEAGTYKTFDYWEVVDLA